MKQKKEAKGDELLHPQEKLALKQNRATPEIAGEQKKESYNKPMQTENLTSGKNEQEQSEDKKPNIKGSKQKLEQQDLEKSEEERENLSESESEAAKSKFTNAGKKNFNKKGLK